MNQEGPFLKFEGRNMKILATPSFVLEGFVPKEGYPKCCKFHESVLDYVVTWWKKFPNCCKEHEAMVLSGYINKQDYNYVQEKIITCFAYFEYHVSKKINEDNWFTDIKHYIEHLSFSFGHPAIGFAQLQHLLEHYLQNHKPTDWVFPSERRSALIAYLSKKVVKADKKNNDTDLNLLYSIYQKWLKTVPDIHYFSYLKQTTTAKAPMNLFLYDMDYNPYTGMTSSQIKTTVELVQSLFDLTKQVLSQIDTVQMVKDKVISDAQLFKINLINENHRIKQLKLVQEYNKSEAKYVKIIKRWLANEKDYFSELIPELNKLPEPKPLPKPKTFTAKQKQSDSDTDQFHNQNNSNTMTISILNDICYGRLKPWTIDFSDMSKLSQKVRDASKVQLESPLDVHKKLLALLSDHGIYQQLMAKPSFTSITLIPFTFHDENVQNLETIFYKELIDTEALRFYNEVLVNPYIQDLALDVEYQIGRKVLDVLKDLIYKTKEEIENHESSQNTKDADDKSLYVMSHLHKTLLALYFSIQTKYASYLTETYKSIDEFYLLVFNESTPFCKLMKNKNLEQRKLKAFISYSKFDGEECRDPDLGSGRNYLKLFKEKLSGFTDHKGVLETWDDTKLIPGEDWDERINEQLKQADIIFLLVSSSFAATKYIIDKELKIAFDRQSKKECVVVPIIVRKYDGWYDIDWIPSNAALPRKGHSIDTWKANPDCHSEDDMWNEIYIGVKKLIESL